MAIAGSLENLIIIPRDKYNVIYLIFFINGIGTLLPWNMLIQADQYFTKYKLNITDPSPALVNYRTSFLVYLGIASKAPNILLQIANMLVNAENGNLTGRTSVALVIQILVFLSIIMLAIIDTGTWAVTFFWLTMLQAVIINLANGVYQGCVYGLAGRFPMRYTNAVTTGMNFSGTISSLLNIISIAMSPRPKIEAILFFSCAVIVLIGCLGGQFFLRKNRFFQFYAGNQRNDDNSSKNNVKLIRSLSIGCPACFQQGYPKNNNTECPHLQMSISQTIVYNGEATETTKSSGKKLAPESKLKEYFYVFRSTWLLLVNLILLYTVSFSLFPTVLARILTQDHFIEEIYFQPVFCFLAFNAFCTVGNFIAQYVQWPGPRYIIVFTLLRFAFIPFFLYCNFIPDHSTKVVGRSLPVIFGRDWMFITGVVLMSISSGYLSSLCMMYAPRCVRPELAATAGMMSALVIILGILIGIIVSYLYQDLVM